MSNTLNANGRQGWELVGFQPSPPQFPATVDGSVAMRAGAPYGRPDLYPQLADSIEGTVSLNMPPVELGSCRLILKRKAGNSNH